MVLYFVPFLGETLKNETRLCKRWCDKYETVAHP